MRVLVLMFLAAPALADCPPVPDRAEEKAELFARAHAAETELAARPVMARLWEIWTDAPDEAAQALLDRGMAALRISDHLAARRAFDRLVDYCPDYAEGWNQRAYVHFLTGRHAAALADLERAVEIDPAHAAALAGGALTLQALGRPAAAQRWLRRALALNPWLPERRLLRTPPGRDL